MIVDAHCHVWNRWPYEPEVPDPETRARAEQLLWHMDRNGVDRAVVIAASIGDNPANANDAFAAAEAAGGRLVVFPDLECRWSAEFRTPGAAGRLSRALDRWGMVGFTTYLAEEEDGSWMLSEEGEAFFALAERAALVASLSVMPHQVAAVAELARRHPELPILLHHHAFFGPRSGTSAADGSRLAPAAECPNVRVKLSGLGNLAFKSDEYPYPALGWVPRLMLELFGPDRLVWGSDFPVSCRYMTYRQTLDVLRRHDSIDDADLPAVLGRNIDRLLGQTVDR